MKLLANGKAMGMDDFNDNPQEEALELRDALLELGSDFDNVLERYMRCQVCGSHLHFSYNTDFSHNVTVETAKCLECASKTRKLLHKLQ